ncbi:MAG TPA: DUF1801 domain-containing protein [Chitinophagaceae bacterium]
MNEQVTRYINEAPPKQRQIMEVLRQLVHDSVPGVQEEFKWGRPVFRSGKDFAYLKTAKAYVTLGFFKFDRLRDEHGRLEGTGKDMRHIKLKTVQDMDGELLKEWLAVAAS